MTPSILPILKPAGTVDDNLASALTALDEVWSSLIMIEERHLSTEYAGRVADLIEELKGERADPYCHRSEYGHPCDCDRCRQIERDMSEGGHSEE